MKKSIAALVALAFLAPAVSFAEADDLDKFSATYPNSSLSGCKVCHTKRPALNAFGEDYKLAGRDFAAIEGLDSDKDGVSNLDEINNGTAPGNK